MKKGSLVIVVLVAVVTASIAQTAKQLVSFDQLFPATQQRSMGLHKLTAQEKEVLRAHVEGLLVQIAASSGRGAYAGTGGGHWVKKNVSGGAYIVLEDGSLWQIDPLDKIHAMLWLPISSITVTGSSSGSPGFDYLLINTDAGEEAHAKYTGKQ